jgi:uncharacterized coiled-coil protein SlyX
MLARRVRERFLADSVKALNAISEAVQERLSELVDKPGSARETQVRRDNWLAYKKARPLWQEGTMKVWRECLEPAKPKGLDNLEMATLELVGTEVVENKILASRLVLAVMEKAGPELEDLRVRLRYLEQVDDLPGNDLLRPEVLVMHMVEQWGHSGMPGDSWPNVHEAVQRLLVGQLVEAYKGANELLIKQGVMPTIELKDRVKAPVRQASASGRSPLTPHGGAPTDTRPSDFGGVSSSGGSAAPAGVSRPMGVGSPHTAPAPASATGYGHTGMHSVPGASGAEPFWRQSSGAQSMHGHPMGAQDETRMMTSTTPLARARSRAQGVIGQIRRLFVSQTGNDFVGHSGAYVPPSPALAAAIAYQPAMAAGRAGGDTRIEDYSPAGVVRVASEIREKTAELKKKAETKSEKAIIEIVALMFQAILAEERIPSAIRVWFARLQMPVLRVALEDADFFGTATHPARMLIDRMGSCVMGFDASGVQGSAMEAEVKRIVQVVEQYPETGKKVYQIVYDEFQKFLAKFLTEKGAAKKVVSVAQQVEQKETLTIQYTIEMRNMLKEMPVRAEIRDFLFKIWAEVLAVAAVRQGPQHADTLVLKKSATDLLWAASAKPNRADRARVIQDLPQLLAHLRSGMTLLAIAPAEQEAHIKTISDTLADAFLSKTQAIEQSKIDAMAQRLGNLEDFVSEDGVGDLPLDAESIEMMLGVDASAIEVVANGGSKPTAAMVAWAQELQVGSWFQLDHNGRITQVQFAWRSDRKHLNLFASAQGKSYLIQAGRLAAYLQAGLLVPQEEESLTIRATRDAISKLEANPERLLA